ncbi:MAG: TerC family protein [Syntrophales bacterium]|nr:TerC family protein [Syntrophales bacterium]MDD5232997.1 TerC family protein [Syntrophales bacterium]HPL62222.1 TerC family protein [Syntrophales bacterium]
MPEILGQIQLNWDFVLGFLSIVVIDLILAGDNAVVIAMAVRTLPREERKKGIIFGAGAAVMLRVVLTFFAAQLLQVQFVKFVGGLLIIWIGIKLFIEGVPDEEVQREAKTFWQAIWVIVVADITMSVDNVLAVAGASGGNLFLLIFGLGLSIPLVVFTSNLLSMLMDKYPIIIYIGAAILGRVGGEMMITDPFIKEILHPTEFLQYGVEIFFTVGVIVAGKLWLRMQRQRQGKIPEVCENNENRGA